MNVRHMKETNRWGTETAYITMARTALGGTIELDPMSSISFNLAVGAQRIYTEDDDGLAHPWIAKTVFLNPAGGLVARAWRKLLHEIAMGHTKRCVWVGFSIEQLCQLANEPVHPLDFSWLLPRSRISFIRHDGYEGSPGHNNYVVALGIAHNAFVRAFVGRGKFGRGAQARDFDRT